MRKPVRIILLEDTGDHRGGSFAIPGPCLEFLDSVRDVHIASMRPGEVRGNHYHRDRREILCVVYTGQWSFHWDTGPQTEIRSESFSGSGVVAVEIEPLASGMTAMQRSLSPDFPFVPTTRISRTPMFDRSSRSLDPRAP